MAMACGSAIGSAKVKFSEKNNGWRRLSEISRFCARKKAQGRGTERQCFLAGSIAAAALALAAAGPIQGQVVWGPPTSAGGVFQGTIVTYAGNGTAGYQGDGKAALQAELKNPFGVALDSAGNLYIADTANNVVRKVNAGTGAISTVAGGAATVCGGASDSLGDGCPAVSAQLNQPQSVAVDSAGNLYIADTSNNVVRKVNATTGIIGTVAGGATAVCGGASDSLGDGCPAVNAKLNGPYSVALDSAGNLYIADAGDNVVREVSGGAIAIVAGNYTKGAGYSGDGSTATAAQLNGPEGVAVDSHGNLYIADTGNNVVREVSGNTIQTIAGSTSGTAGYGGDGGAAASALLTAPSALTFDAWGDFYIADTGNNVVRQVNSGSGQINTVAGNNAAGAGYGGDGGPAASAQLSAPSGVAVDNSGNLYVADAANNRIRQVQMYAVNYGMLGLNQSNPIYALDYGFKYSTPQLLGGAETLTLGQNTQDFYLFPSSGCAPNFDLGAAAPCEADVSFNPQAPGERQGALVLYDNNSPPSLVAETYLSGVGVAPMIAYAPGVINAVAGNGTACAGTSSQCGDGNQGIYAQLNSPPGVAVDSAGDVYIADTNDNVVREVNASTGVIATVAGTWGSSGYSGDNRAATGATLSAPVGLALDGAGNLYIADSGNFVVRVVNGLTGTISTAAGNHSAGNSGDGAAASSAKLGTPQAVAVDGAGNLYIADSQYSVVREVYGATNLIATIAGTGSAGYSGDGGPATKAALRQPMGVAVDSQGNVYIADSGNNVIREIGNGEIATVAGDQSAGPDYSGDGGVATSAQLSNPTGVAVDAAGDIYIADSNNDVIRAVNASTKIISTVVGGGATLCGNPTDGVGDNCAATYATLNQPNSVVVDSAGNLYIADTSNQLARKVDLTDPPTLSFTNYLTGMLSSPQAVTLENLGNAALNISQIAASPDFVINSAPGGCALSNQTLAPSQSCQLSVLFASAADTYNSGNPVTGALTLTDNALNVAGATQQVQLSGITWNPAGSYTSTVALSASGWDLTAGGGGYQQPYGNTLALTVTVSSPSGTPDGFVSIYDGANSLGVASLNNGVATITVAALPVGAHSISAAYSGSYSYASSTSSALGYTVVATSTGGPAQPSLVSITAPTFPLTTVGNSVMLPATASVVSGSAIFNANSFAIAPGFTDYTLGTVTGCATNGVTSSSPGTTCTIPVTFTPSLPGLASAPVPLARSAPLLINDVENGVPANYAVALSGGGTESLAVITPGIISDPVGNDQTPQTGYAGDGGAPSGAVYNQPQSMAVDGAGNIFIADTGNCIVRKVSKSGNTVSTVAGVAPTGGAANCGIGTDGGAATSSMLSQPSSVALDAAGNLYIADTGNNAIRMVSAATGKIGTVAGNLDAAPAFDGDGGLATSAHLNGPKGVAVDGFGNIYIADTGNYAVREVTASTGYISTPAGIGGVQATVLGYGGLLPATSVALWGPQTVAVDSLGGVYIADTPNSMLLYVDANQNLNQVNGPTGTPVGLSVDASGKLFYTQTGDCNVYETTSRDESSYTYWYNNLVAAGNGGCTASGDGGYANQAGLNHPQATTVDSRGDIYILEADGVRYVDVSWSNPIQFGKVNIGSSQAQQFVLSNGDVQTATYGTGVQQIDYLASSLTSTYSPFSIAGATGSVPQCVSYAYLYSADSCATTVAFTPTADGAASDTLQLGFTTTPGIPVQGTGAGAQPTVSLSASLLSFTGVEGMGYGDAQTVSLTNTSAIPLTIFSITPTQYTIDNFHAVASATNPCGSTLSAGASCNISVVFDAPSVNTAASPFTDTLTITDDASTGGGTQTVSLTGTGTEPVVQLSATSINLGTTAPGNTLANTLAPLTITNIGTAPLTFCSTAIPSGSKIPICFNSNSVPTAALTLSGVEPDLFAIQSTTCGATLAAGASCNVVVQLTPPIAGSFSAVLSVNDNSSGASLRDYYASQTVTLSGSGQIPTGYASITVTNTAFPTTAVGVSSGTQNVSVRLNQPLALKSIALQSGFNDFQIMNAITGCTIDGATINPAGTICTVPVAFLPLAPGNSQAANSRQGPLVVTTVENAAPTPYVFPLSGVATGPIAALTPGVLSHYVGANPACGAGVNYGLSNALGQDGLPAVDAGVGTLNGMAMDSAGNMYLSDSMNFVIWKVDTAGVIHLYAGSPGSWGCGGYDQVLVGNGGPAMGATVEGGGPLAVDAVGGLIIGDSEPGVSSIRRIDPETQVITSLVGNPGWDGTQGNTWMSNTRYFPGAIIQASVPETIAGYPTVNTNVVFTTTTGGVSGPTAPNFSPVLVYNKSGTITATGVNVTEGTVTWSLDKIGTFSGVGCASQVDKYGDGCTSVNAALLNVNGIALDSQGNLYFSDWQPNGTIYTGNGGAKTDNTATVRRMDAQTGIVTVYAGNVNNASYGHAGDGKSATDPSVLISPTSLAFDSQGNLYILEGGYVRMVSAATGKISTVAGNGKPYSDSGNRGFNCAGVGDGGPATSAQLNVIDIAFDAADNMYLLGSGNCALRRVDAATQIITTIAGDSLDLQNSQNYTSFPYPFYNPAYGLGYLGPKALRLDGNANIYVATGGEGVQKIDTSHSFMDFTWDTLPNIYPVGSSAGPLTSTVVNAGNSGPLTFTSPFTDPLAFGISSGDFTRDSSASDCIANASTGLMPGTECPIHIDFTPTTVGAPLIETDMLNDNGTIATQGIALYGNSESTPTVTLLPHLLSFASTVGVSPATQSLTLTNNTSSDVPITGVSLAGPGLSAFLMSNGCPSTLSANGGNCQIGITFLSPALGQYLAQVVVTDTIAGVASKQLSSLVGLTGTANASFRPDAHDFGQINIDLTSNPVEFELVSSGSVPVIVTSVKLTGNNPDQFQITTNGCTSGLSIAPGSHCSVWVEFAPTRDSPLSEGLPSDFTAQLEAKDNAGNSPQYASLSGMGVGTAPILLNISETIHVTAAPPSMIEGILLPISETIHVSDVAGTVTAGKTSNTITFTAPASPVTYGASPITLSASASSGLAASFSTTGPCSVSGATLSFSGAGSCAVTANQAGNASYASATPVTKSITVNPAALTITASSATVNYGATTPSITPIYAGFVNGDSPSSLTTVPTCSTTYTPTSAPNSYPTNCAGAVDANYSIAYVAGSVTVSKAANTITFTAPASLVTYGASAVTLSASASSGLTVSFGATGACSVSGSTLTFTGARSCAVTANQAGNASYAPATPVTDSITVNPAALTVTAANASRAYGVANPAFTDTIAGYVSGDTSSAVSGAASLTTTATTTSVAGTYPISAAQGTLAASNYSFAFVSGTLTVNQATPTVTWAMPAAISYGTALSGAQLDASSAVAGTFAYTPALGTVLKAGSGQTLSVTFTPTDTTDYATPAAATTTLTVNQATPTITWATPAAITYGTALSGAQLNASSAVAGTFVYTPVTGTVLATGTQTLSVIFTPTDATDYTPAVLTVQLNVTNITVSGTAVSVAPGATTGNTSTITVTPVSGFTGTVSLSCAISPTAASDPATCSLSPASVAISGAAQTSTLTVSTTAATTCSAMNHPKLPREPWYAVGGATLACLLLFGIPAQRRSWRTLLGMLALLVALSGGVLACGGGTGGGGGNNCTPNSGTTAGSYTITVTGTSGTITATNTITLTVQ